MLYCIGQKVELIRASLNPYSPLPKSGSASSGGRIRKRCPVRQADTARLESRA